MSVALGFDFERQQNVMVKYKLKARVSEFKSRLYLLISVSALILLICM